MDTDVTARRKPGRIEASLRDIIAWEGLVVERGTALEVLHEFDAGLDAVLDAMTSPALPPHQHSSPLPFDAAHDIIANGYRTEDEQDDQSVTSRDSIR